MSLYPTPTNIWESIEYSTLGTTIAESTWMFPTIETIHVIALVTVLGTIAIVDLRLIGAITGSLLFVSKASSYVANPWFLWKMCMMALAGFNMMYFNFITQRTVE